MSTQLHGMQNWEMSRDEIGHRTYEAKWLIVSDDKLDGPAVVYTTPGLPVSGSIWSFGNDLDDSAYCWPNWVIQPVVSDEPGYWWQVRQNFSTKPMKRCQDSSIENPLLEPPRIGGSFTKYNEEAHKDRFGNAIVSTSHEMLRGPSLEFDKNRPNVTIGMNVASLPLVNFAPLIDVVNDSTMWGLPPRCVKLSDVRWQRQLYGTCSYFWTVEYQFDISYTTFDRYVLNEGHKCLQGWAPGSKLIQLDPDGIDPDTGAAYKLNPKRFEVYKDKNGENTRCLLDLNGKPLADGANPTFRYVEKYEESNLFLLGIPTDLSA